MRILFLEVDTESSWAVASMGPAFLAAVLRREGHEVSLLRAGVDLSVGEVVAEVVRADPSLIGVSLTTRQWLRARDLVAAIRGAIDVPVVAGGLHATFASEAVLASPGFDFACLGEGEEAVVELAAALGEGQVRPDVRNVRVRGGPLPELRPPFEPIDALPFLARDLLDEPPGVAHVSTQRGCPFPCTYCAARMYDRLYADRGASYGRRRSHESVVSELVGLREAGRLAYAIFLDDTFTIHHPWVREYCRIHRERVGVPFSIHARVETVSERLVGELADAGCHQITYGVESGSPRVRREVMKRHASDDRIRDVVRWTREAGILVTANYMLGLPGETPEDLARTVALAEELPVHDFGYFVFYPYPGTELYHECRRRGLLPADHAERPANHRESILSLPDLSREAIAEAYERLTALRERRFRELAPGLRETDVTAHVRERAASG